jgi:hypothetical protein
VVVELLFVALLAARPSPLVSISRHGYPGWISGPLSDLGRLLPAERWFLKVTLVVVVVTMCAGYVAVLVAAPAVRVRWAVAAIVLAHVVLFLGPPLLLTDVFTYFDYARVGVVHGLNPYTDAPVLIPHDPVFRWDIGVRRPTVYGPLFTAGTYGLVPLGLAGGLWALKAAVVLADLGAVALVAACARRLGRPPVAAALAVGLNPLLLLYGVGGFHNDMLMMLFLAAGVYFALAARDRLVGPAMVAAVGIKASALPIVPFIILGARGQRRAWVWTALAAAGLVAMTALLFGLSFPGLESAASHQETRNTLPWLASRLLGYGHVPGFVRVAATVALGATILVLLRRTLRDGDWITAAGWSAFAALITLSTISAYYIVWLLPLAVLSRSRPLHVATIALGLFLLSYFHFQFTHL